MCHVLVSCLFVFQGSDAFDLFADECNTEPSEASDRLVLSMQACCRTLISFVGSQVRLVVAMHARQLSAKACVCFPQVLSPEAKSLVTVAVLEVGVILDISHMFSPLWERLSRARLASMKRLRDEVVEASREARAAAELALTVCSLLS
jgi:hypothetical protein